MKKKHTNCPLCGEKVAWENNPFRPFCSERCKLMDLGKWASDEYRIPGEKKDSPTGSEDEKNTSEK